MNKQELIERIEGLKNLFGNKVECIEIDAVIELVSKLDEPEKVVVPQFVANWIEEARKSCKDVADFFDFDFTNEEVGKWFMQERPFDLAARAWLDGYEIEEEKRYLVTFKNGQPLVKSQSGSTLYFSQDITAGNYKVTRKELEDAGFSEVFNNPLFEVEEVE